MKKSFSPKRMKQIDGIAYDLWKAYVQPYVKKSRRRASEMKLLFESRPGPGSSHPVIKKIVKDGRGIDGWHAAMMTWDYLAAVCRYQEKRSYT